MNNTSSNGQSQNQYEGILQAELESSFPQTNVASDTGDGMGKHGRRLEDGTTSKIAAPHKMIKNETEVTGVSLYNEGREDEEREVVEMGR